MAYIIENVELSKNSVKRPDRRGRPSRFPLRDMGIGQSFTIGPEEVKNAGAACRYATRTHNAQFAWAYENPRWRIYRVK